MVVDCCLLVPMCSRIFPTMNSYLLDLEIVMGQASTSKWPVQGEGCYAGAWGNSVSITSNSNLGTFISDNTRAL